MSSTDDTVPKEEHIHAIQDITNKQIFEAITKLCKSVDERIIPKMNELDKRITVNETNIENLKGVGKWRAEERRDKKKVVYDFVKSAGLIAIGAIVAVLMAPFS